MKPLVGIYSRPTDDHLERVVSELQRRRIPWLRFDTADFPQFLRVAARLDRNEDGWQGTFLLGDTHHHLEEFCSIWYRRPTKTYTFPTMSETGYEYARAEARKGFGGLLQSLSCLWVSLPDAISAAECKPKQLEYARQLGWSIPKTLITNDPQAALCFFDECQGEVIYKPFNQGIPRPKKGEPWRGAIYTTKMTRSALQEYALSITSTATLFQQYIPKAFELRINVVGSRVFAAEIHSQQTERAKIDFRMGYEELSYRIHQLPREVEEHCLALVRRFNLEFSAIDTIVTPQNEYVFLELNPCGQWGWIENHTGLPLTEALVDLLVTGKSS